MSPEVQSSCLMLAYTGARVSELLALTPRRFDFAVRLVIVESLKKRQRGIYRPKGRATHLELALWKPACPSTY